MLLPNFENAFIDDRKLIDYCLNENHPVGKNKAQAFKRVLSFEKKDADKLKEIILEGVKYFQTKITLEDDFGLRYSVEMIIHKFGRRILLKTSWIIKKGEDFPRLTSCYVKKS